jgi:type IV pilus biogenesis protein CpaD/CtpE
MLIAPTRLSLLVALSAAVACSSKDAASDAAATGAATSTDAPAVASGAEPTANEISNYKLDMDKMRKYTGAIKSFSTMSAEDSTILAAMSSGSANESTVQMISRIESSPVAMRILRENGLSAKDYVWITAAYIQAAMTEGMMASNPAAKLPEGQNPQNVDFLKANKAALETMMRDAGMTQ